MSTAPSFQNPLQQELEDWGPVRTMIEGQSHTSGRILDRSHGESGIWECTPGWWRCVVGSDEFCHFLAGRATYVHDSGDVIEIEPATTVFFPAGWQGTCRVHETVRKVYTTR